jgi:predicted lipoprotein
MLDWLVEVTTVYKCRDRTYFLAVQLFDNYLRTTESLTNKDVHLIGITSLFLASKYEDLSPLSCQLISDKISHNVHSNKDILASHERMLFAFDFNLDVVTYYDHQQVILQILTHEVDIIKIHEVTSLSLQFIMMVIQNIEFV